MPDGDKPLHWWQTLPGLLASLAAAITATGGLLVTLQGIGWIGRPGPVVSASSPSAAPRATAASGSTGATASSAPGANVGASAAADGAAPVGVTERSVELPALRDYVLGPGGSDVRYTLLGATLSDRSSQKRSLRLQVRMTNLGSNDVNFWDSSFRLVIDDVPIAPSGGLNLLVAAHAAREGEVLFVLPKGTTRAVLRIRFRGDDTDIPLPLPG